MLHAFRVFLLALALQAVCASAVTEQRSDLIVPGAVEAVQRLLVQELYLNTSVRADELHPFCDVDAKRGSGPHDEDNCASFAEQEVDMVLMLMDLLAKGVPERTATAFYNEIRCLSRANVERGRDGKLRVCFRRDYSRAVGELLAKYIEPVVAAADADGQGDALSTAARVSDDKDMDHIFEEMNEQPRTENTENTACCQLCFTEHYFPHLVYRSCVDRPSGEHCCHTICQALQRVKTGMESSVSYCCPKLYPQPCLF